MANKRPNLVRKLEERRKQQLARRKVGAEWGRIMGIARELNQLGSSFRHTLLAYRAPKPVVTIDPEINHNKEAGLIAQAIRETLNGIRAVDNSDPDLCFSFEEFATTGLPMAMNIVGSANIVEKHQDNYKAKTPIGVWTTMSDRAWDFVRNEAFPFCNTIASKMFREAILPANRIDGRIYWCEMPGGDDLIRLKPCVFTLRSRLNPEERVVINGTPRRVFQVAAGVMDYQPVSLPAAMFGGIGGDLPIYIQSHALHRLHERVPNLDGVEWSLFTSMKAPAAVIPGDNPGEFLIPYYIFGSKIGYCLAVVVDRKVVIQTFLFLTMRGTPESKILFEKLRLKRYDIERLKLDGLEQFVGTDIFDDPDLKQLLTDCGCGDLAVLRSRIVVDGYRQVATQLKQELKLDRMQPPLAKPARPIDPDLPTP